ncbi:MAG: PKD domain-containing protein [Anaerolineae bacterium]
MALVASACNLSSTDATQQIDLTSAPTNTPQPSRTPLGTSGAPTTIPLPSGQPQTRPTSIILLPPTVQVILPPTNTPLPVNIAILSPVPGNVVSGNVQVVGAAAHPQFLQYQIEFGPDPNPGNLWYPATYAVQTPVLNGLLGIWNTTLTQDALYQLRVNVYLRDGSRLTTVVNNIRVQNQRPTPIPTATQNIPRPIAAFTQNLTAGTVPFGVQFTNQSAGSITSVLWNFGDGATSTELNPNHTFTSPGLYSVTLTVQGPGGTSNVSRLISAQSATPPVAGFTQNTATGIAPLAVQFTDTSAGVVTGYQWNFSDGSTSTDRNPSHVFVTPGVYNVLLTVTGPGGSSFATRQIVVQGPTPTFTPTSTNTPITPTATATLTLTGVPPTATFTSTATATFTETPTATPTTTNVPPTLTFTPTSTGTNTNLPPTATPSATSTASVTSSATATATATSSETPTATATLTPIPMALSFSAQQQPGTTTVLFSNTSTGAVAYLWQFGDGGSSNETSPTYTYAQGGTYLVTLIGQDSLGQQQQTQQQITVVVPTATETPSATPSATSTPIPMALSFSAQQQPGTTTVLFSNTSTGAVAYLWQFGDGGSSNEASPTYTYAQGGTYLVTLIGQDSLGQQQQTQQQITVVVPTATPTETPTTAPIAPSFTAQQQSGSLNVVFTNTTTGAVSFAWQFGDGGSSNETSPIYTYAQGGTYTVTLLAHDGLGQQQQVQQQINVVQSVFTFVPTDLSVTFTNTSLGSIASYAWDFGDGQFSNEMNPTHVYGVDGTYNVQLTATAVDGFTTHTSSQQVTVQAAAVQPIDPGMAGYTDIQPNIGAIQPNLRSIYDNGVNNFGRLPYVFTFVGDHTFEQSGIIDAFTNGNSYNLGSNGDLQAIVDWYNFVGPSGTGSFNSVNHALNGGYHVADLLNAANNPPGCGPTDTPVQCDITLSNASVILIAVGYRDAVDGTDIGTFTNDLNTVVQTAINNGVIPVLFTIRPTSDGSPIEQRTAQINDAIISVANSHSIPVVNVWRALHALPGDGESGNDLSLSPGGAGDLTDGALSSYGASVLNQNLLRVLSNLRNQVFPDAVTP